MEQKVKILYVEDDPSSEILVRRVLESEGFQVVTTSDGLSAIEMAKNELPDIILMDLHLPVLDSIKAIRTILDQNDRIRILCFSSIPNDRYAIEAIKAGARAYLLKDADSDELLRAIRAVAAGEALLDPGIALKMIEEFRRLQSDPVGADGITQLTGRELDILRLVAQGLDNNEIGDRLGLSEKTVRNRLTVIFEKLHVNNRTQAALYALRRGLTSLEEEDD